MMKMQTLKKLFLILTILFIPFLFIAPSKAQSQNYSIEISTDMPTVKAGEDFNITIKVQNTSPARINNFEIRVPFARTIQDTSYISENPAHNKVLDSIEFPAGFTSRSWVINTFDPGETQTYTISYKVNTSPQNPNGLISNVTLPVTWVDPAGLPSNRLNQINYFRADIYQNRAYQRSHQLNLPKLQSINTPVSTVALNSKYTFSGSKTTDLKTVTTENIKAFPNFTLETSELIIEWTTPTDFSSQNTPQQLSSLDTNLITDWGKIDFNPANLPFLANKPVKVTFKNANFVIAPKIKIDNEVKELKDAKGTFTSGNKLITLELDKLGDVTVVPEIILETAVIETDQERVDVRGKVSDPRTPISYKIGNSENQVLSTIDISTGDFSIPVEIRSGSVQVEITTKYRNNEETKKVAIVRKTSSSTNQPAQSNSSGRISDPFNTITIGLILAAIGTLAIIGGLIYYLVRSKKPNLKKDDSVNPIVSKTSTIGIRRDPEISNTSKTTDKAEEIKANTSQTVDMKSLREKYLKEDSSESGDTKERK